MLFSLVKKDFLIVKKYVGIMLIVSFLIPPIMLWRTPEAAGAIGFHTYYYFQYFHVDTICFLKGTSISESNYSALCNAISP